MLAGVNAARAVKGESVWIPRRDEAYLGVLVDDLITRGTREPYRMFTSRAEYRLLLREDNADLRLTPAGRELGLVDDERWAAFEAKRSAIETERERLGAIRAGISSIDKDALTALLGTRAKDDSTALDLLRRPDISYEGLMTVAGIGPGVEDVAVASQVEVQARYHDIERQQREIAKHREQSEIAIPADMDFAAVRGLSTEVSQKLAEFRPATVGQAGRIDGVTPAAISLLLVHLHRRKKGASSATALKSA